jgi:hypothetical protein
VISTPEAKRGRKPDKALHVGWVVRLGIRGPPACERDEAGRQDAARYGWLDACRYEVALWRRASALFVLEYEFDSAERQS